MYWGYSGSLRARRKGCLSRLLEAIVAAAAGEGEHQRHPPGRDLDVVDSREPGVHVVRDLRRVGLRPLDPNHRDARGPKPLDQGGLERLRLVVAIVVRPVEDDG